MDAVGGRLSTEQKRRLDQLGIESFLENETASHQLDERAMEADISQTSSTPVTNF